MEDDKGAELLVVGGNVLSNPGPVVHGHVAGVQQWFILVNTVEDAVIVECQPACGVCVCVCVLGGGVSFSEHAVISID